MEASTRVYATENSDGSYIIRTAVTDGNSVVEVEDASKVSGANVQQWVANGASCQNWILEAVADPGCSMDPNVIYTFRNGNSGLVMDIANGKMNDGTNVQQWDSNGLDCQKWTLQAFGSGNYYWIRSVQDNGYALKAENNQNGGNISLAAYSKKDSSQLFRFTKNPDGSYGILSHTSGDTKYVEVEHPRNGAISSGNRQEVVVRNGAAKKSQYATTTTQTTVTLPQEQQQRQLEQHNRYGFREMSIRMANAVWQMWCCFKNGCLQCRELFCQIGSWEMCAKIRY
ncbi:MAG: RICIN domain-containing protein [Ruminococcus sp.]